MRDMYVADVKHGLCVAIRTVPGEVMQIDCGSRPAGRTAFEGWRRILNSSYFPDVFVLSHFHADHYSGLVYASNNCGQCPKLRIRRVFYPRIPDFKGREKFAACVCAMNSRVFGNETGIMETDFLNALWGITPKSFTFTHESLFSGRAVHLNGSTLRILWPPRTIDNGKTLSVIDRALARFEKAMNEDKETADLYRQVRDEGTFKVYLGQQGRGFSSQEHTQKHASSPCKSRKLPEVVKRANGSLREAANHLSLAFLEDNRFLFLGDTEAWEIRQIVTDLQFKGTRNFHILITPHHGTHWDNSLRELRCVYSVTSKSKKQILKPGFYDISQRVITTSIHGDRAIPMPPTRAPGSRS